MTRSALPPHIDEAHEWKGTDHDNRWQRWYLHIKHWFAFGPRAKEWWAQWREYPIALLGVHGFGIWRFEDDQFQFGGAPDYNLLFLRDPQKNGRNNYLSAIQYWSRWSLQFQWPLFVAFHIYWRPKDVPVYPDKPVGTSIRKMFFFRIGARRDADRVYWFPSLFIGGSWN